ncbi:Lnb N-terminal periplasmic domain-containing protein [Psychromonas sp. Urea-02u-13]|uniref:Lnb N-terminal periplasmic domain-containing protein n=1 Tax=Psychromonas sp. Urea-02u-13 TaxID=2058326 RepID=UPI000C32A024|nr:DUF4105 domain-containing protein [Psychromonas sp. Urea-02u-13]PKG40170.1 hypothetical protein CXF74_05005 [Psychromonas sp. Urea-02u-13]
MNIKSKILAILFIYFPSSLFATVYSLDNLAQNRYWLQLGHYRTATLSDWKSEVDSHNFFLADNGKIDPRAELQATVDTFNGEGLTKYQVNQAMCQFPARFTWLKSKVENDWVDPNCVEFNKWKSVIEPEGITLVFPTAFMNNPSSMFGHTLLRIDAKNQTRNKELVAFAVNFAAEPDADDNAATYAFKGLVGQYPGNFSLMPYYRKVREYNDLESRDIWEYKLKLTPSEVDLILLHLWELQFATFDYYFIDENCSYQLLGLLQLAREDLDLTSSFSMHAIPSDTVAALRDNQLLDEPNYRPAFGTKLFHFSEQMTDQELQAARDIKDGKSVDLSGFTSQKQASILEMAYEWLNFEFYDQGLSRKSIAPRLTNLLIQRSKIKLPSAFTQPLQPEISPELGHSSSRLGLSINGYDDNATRYSLSYRLAYHDLLDKSAGFIPGAKISFLDIEASINNDLNSRIERLYLIDAMSLAPDNRIFTSWSWNIRIGYDRQVDNSKHSGRWFTQGGYGKSIGDPNALHAYFLASFELNGGDITNNSVEVGLGSELGTVWQVNNNNKIALTGNIMWLVDTDVDYHNQLNLAWNWAFDTDWALRSKISHQQWRDEDVMAKLTLFHYF